MCMPHNCNIVARGGRCAYVGLSVVVARFLRRFSTLHSNRKVAPPFTNRSGRYRANPQLHLQPHGALPRCVRACVRACVGDESALNLNGYLFSQICQRSINFNEQLAENRA